MRVIGTALVAAILAAGAAACAPPRGSWMEGESQATKQTLLFYTTSGTDHPHRAVLPFVFAISAKEKGHEAIVFLAGDGVLLMKDSIAADVKGVGQPTAAEVLKKAVDLKIPIHV